MSANRRISRRQFLTTSASASLALAVRTGAARADSQRDPWGGFLVGVQTYSFRQFPAEQALKLTRELGLHYIELYPGPHLRQTSKVDQIAAVRRLCSTYGITPRAYGVVRFRKDHDYNRKAFELGRALGIRAFSADPDPDSFDSLDKLVAEYQIAVGIHPHGPNKEHQLHRWYSAEVILQAVKDHNPLIGAYLDTGHLLRAGLLGKHLDPAQQIQVMGARNYGIHLKDVDLGKDINVPFGKGSLDVLAVLRALRGVGFQGLISLEYEANPENPVPDMAASLSVFREAVKKLS
jgi:sugar phosphate isomerase/epimerase